MILNVSSSSQTSSSVVCTVNVFTVSPAPKVIVSSCGATDVKSEPTADPSEVHQPTTTLLVGADDSLTVNLAALPSVTGAAGANTDTLSLGTASPSSSIVTGTVRVPNVARPPSTVASATLKFLESSTSLLSVVCTVIVFSVSPRAKVNVVAAWAV